MNDYVLCGGSTVDLTCEYLKERNIEWIGFHFSIDDKEFVDDMGVNLSSADFYQAAKPKRGSSIQRIIVNFSDRF